MRESAQSLLLHQPLFSGSFHRRLSHVFLYFIIIYSHISFLLDSKISPYMKLDLIFVFSVRGIQLSPYDVRKTEAFKDKLNRKTENVLLELVG